MGAWGYGNFENDDALDWIGELKPPKRLFFGLLKTDPISICLDPVQHTIDTDYVEADIACELLAAAECIALVRGHPAKELPEDVLAWHEQIKDLKTQAHDDEIHQWVIEAVERIKKGGESELNDLWNDSDEYKCWISVVDDLLDRLRLPSS